MHKAASEITRQSVLLYEYLLLNIKIAKYTQCGSGTVRNTKNLFSGSVQLQAPSIGRSLTNNLPGIKAHSSPLHLLHHLTILYHTIINIRSIPTLLAKNTASWSPDATPRNRI